MANPDQFRLRVTFCKAGRCAMLSHLEIARALERAVRRAGLPYAVSQGFSPHMKIAFGAALPVGVGGTEEIFDVQLVRWVNPAEALSALQRASVEDLMPSACAYIGPRDAAASVAYPVGEYEAVFSAPLETLELPPTVTVVRKKKEKTITVADCLAEGPSQEALPDGGAVVRFALRALPTGSLRSDLVVAELAKANPGVQLQTLTRTCQRAC